MFWFAFFLKICALCVCVCMCLVLGKVFPTGKVDLSVRERKPKNDLEAIQQVALLEVDQFCMEYEKQIKALGGYGFFLGGIGHDGHIAFNFRGCDPRDPTRLVTLNYETAAQSATDFGGISFTRNKSAVTVLYIYYNISQG